MEVTMEYINTELLPHWPFLAFALVTGVIAQIMKTQILTVDIAAKNKIAFWMRRAFPLLLIALGAVTGAAWPGETSPGVSDTTAKMWYFMGSACVAISGFSVFKNWVKKKYDIEILQGSVTPPEYKEEA
jgi:hypothetical protein